MSSVAALLTGSSSSMAARCNGSRFPALPLMAKSLASTDEYAAVVCTGLVVDGGIYRHEFVASAVIDGLMRTQLDTGVPVFSGVLTPHDFVSEGRPEFFRQHFVIKGEEVAEACARTLSHYCLEAA